MATDSSTATASNESPRHSSSDKSGRNTRAVLSPKWTQIVRGGESETNVAAAASAAVSTVVAEPSVVVTAGEEEEENVENGNGARRPAWNKLSNGAVEIAPVMGAESWPALSESARISTKSSSDSFKGLSDGSSSSQGIGTVSSPSKKYVSNIAIPNSTPNNMIPVRQRSMKRNTANTSANSGNPQSPGSQGQLGEINANNPSPRDYAQRNFHSRAANDHSQLQRNSFRNSNGGTQNHNYGGRRDQESTNQDWNNHQNFNGRDSHVQSQRGYPRFVRHRTPPPSPPPTSAPFIPPPPVRPYGGPMGYPEMAAPVYYVAAPSESFRGLPFVAGPIPPHPVFFSPSDIQLPSRILNQIEYYFSDDNLIKDMYLRQKMDNDGWVSINLIAGFKKVAQLTDSIPLILDSLRSSNIVEVQGDQVRRRNEWMKWIINRPMVVPSASSSQSSVNSDHEILAASVQHMSLGENTGEGNSRKGSSEFVDNSEPTRSEEAFQASNQGDAVPTARSSNN